MDKISIVVAVFNAEKTINKCVDSLLNQTYDNTEIILVNDCSQDESLKICNEYALQNINVKVVNNPQNLGVSATRNNGIDVASGRYICFVDSDDYVENNYLERLHYYAEKYNTVPICGFMYHDEFNHKKPVAYQWSGGDEIVSLGEAFRLNRELYLTALWNKLFLLEPIKKYCIKFDTAINIGEDLRFSVEYFEKCNLIEVYAFTEPLYHYLKISDSNLLSNFTDDIENSFEHLRVLYKLSDKFSINSKEEYQNAVDALPDNYIYNMMKRKDVSNKQKLLKIKTLTKQNSIKVFCYFKYILLKERIVNFFSS